MTELPIGAEIDSDQLWSQILNRPQIPAGSAPGDAARRPCLFLDRDGVIVEDTGYLHRPEDVRLIEGAADMIARANQRSVAVVVVTNQAGIARGLFGWHDFIAVQETIIGQLDQAFLNAVFACPHHKDGKPPFDSPDHAWRKPNPGMLLEAALRLPIDLKQSWLIGDRAQDLQAAKTAGLAGGIHVLTGHGSDDGERSTAEALGNDGFQALCADSINAVEGLLPVLGD